jgi:drug/metabolite transporter (DMT)-like permease
LPAVDFTGAGNRVKQEAMPPADHSHIAAPGILFALASALLFGASTPFAKLLLGALDPWMLAGLLYLGSGLGLGALWIGRYFIGSALAEAPLRRPDIPWLAAIVLAGGVISPVLLMVGLTLTSASTAALLLNLEGLATMGIAWLVFREHVDRRLLLGAFAILAGAILLSWDGRNDGIGVGWGTVVIAGACLFWGIDNNLTRKLSAADPVQIAAVKGLIAGAVNLALSSLQGSAMPSASVLLGAGLVGLAGYGFSLVLFVLALRHLGTGRTGAYFSTAPFVGAVLAIAMLGDPVTLSLIAAAALMGAGVYLHVAERHEHEHQHAAIEHEHRHRHDDHHQHVHEAGDLAGEPHAHRHRHAAMMHKHPHYPDLHHRHSH